MEQKPWSIGRSGAIVLRIPRSRGQIGPTLHPSAPSSTASPRLYLGASVVVLGVALLIARFWHPAYGFTAFLQFDSSDVPHEIQEMAAAPVYVYPGNDGYDGFSYAEIAFHPLLGSAELKPALGNVPYRARRILNSALAWTLAGGRADRIAHTFAALNLPLWALFAWACWRVLAVRDARGWWLWAGLVLSAGVLHSVRLALTDLLGVLLFGASLYFSETGRKGALATLAAGGLARETILADVVSLWTGPWDESRAWVKNAVRSAVAALPLALWLVWVRHKAGSAPQGFGNFTWPGIGWWGKWRQALAALRTQPQFFWVNLATVLALCGLSLQAAYVIARPRWGNAWWRAAAAGVVMLLCFGTSVWEGNPGAAHRVLLPLSLAFAVLALRDGARWGWIVVGNLSVLSGVLALWTVPHDVREIGAGRSEGIRYVIRLGNGWYGCERAKSKLWSWTAQSADLEIRSWPPAMSWSAHPTLNAAPSKNPSATNATSPEQVQSASSLANASSALPAQPNPSPGNGSSAASVQPAPSLGNAARLQALGNSLILRLGIRSLSPRQVEIRDDDEVIWRGAVGLKLEEIEVPMPQNLPKRGGPLALHFACDAAPVREGAAADARELGFAIYNPVLVSP